MTLASQLAAAVVMLASGPVFATPDDLATIECECGAKLKLPPGGCACLAENAGKLTDQQHAFIAAVVTKDKTTQNSIMQTMTVAELTEAGMFMTTAPAKCAGG